MLKGVKSWQTRPSEKGSISGITHSCGLFCLMHFSILIPRGNLILGPIVLLHRDRLIPSVGARARLTTVVRMMVGFIYWCLLHAKHFSECFWYITRSILPTGPLRPDTHRYHHQFTNEKTAVLRSWILCLKPHC